ncbi:hypothetical protein ACLOJK_024180 [Asimina triloba]
MSSFLPPRYDGSQEGRTFYLQFGDQRNLASNYDDGSDKAPHTLILALLFPL